MWIVYNNVSRKGSYLLQDEAAQMATKAEIHYQSGRIIKKFCTSYFYQKKKKLLDLGWYVLSQPLYSPDLVPSDDFVPCNTP